MDFQYKVNVGCIDGSLAYSVRTRSTFKISQADMQYELLGIIESVAESNYVVLDVERVELKQTKRGHEYEA